MNTVLTRFKEPSTWRGLSILLALFGVKMHPELSDAIITAGAAVVGAIEVVRKENKP